MANIDRGIANIDRGAGSQISAAHQAFVMCVVVSVKAVQGLGFRDILR